LLDDATEGDGGAVGLPVDGSNGVGIGLCNDIKEVQVPGGQCCSCVDKAAEGRAVAAAHHQPELQGDVRECGLDLNWESPPCGRLEDWDRYTDHEDCGPESAAGRAGRACCDGGCCAGLGACGRTRKDLFVHLLLTSRAHNLKVNKFTTMIADPPGTRFGSAPTIGLVLGFRALGNAGLLGLQAYDSLVLDPGMIAAAAKAFEGQLLAFLTATAAALILGQGFLGLTGEGGERHHH
jgi:hypothetical protein